MKRQRTNYDDKFDDVMKYAEMKVDAKGVKIKIRDKEDLRRLFEMIDRKNKQQGRPRLSRDFIDKIIDTHSAKNYVGETIGRFGVTKEFKETQLPMRAMQYRNQGRTIYHDEARRIFAVKESFRPHKRNRGIGIRFRNIRTGRLTSGRNLREL